MFEKHLVLRTIVTTPFRYPPIAGQAILFRCTT